MDGWIPFQLILNRPLVVPTTGRELPPEFQETGVLRRGRWDPAAADYDSRNTWHVEDDAVHVRIPWGLLGVGDPSSRTMVMPEPGGPEEVVAERREHGGGGVARAAGQQLVPPAAFDLRSRSGDRQIS